MTPSRSFYRAAILTGVAVFLFSFAHVTPAAAQDTTRYMTSCTAQAQVGQWGKSCTMTVPAGKVFIIESATVYGGFGEGQRVQVTLTVRFNGVNYTLAVPAASPMVDENGWGIWTGAIPGPIFSEGGFADPGQIFFSWSRWGSASGQPTYRVTLSGRLEDR